MIRLALLLFSLNLLPFSTALALGGTSVKGGGQGIICGQNVQVLEIFEASHLEGHDFLQGGDSSYKGLNEELQLWVEHLHTDDVGAPPALLGAFKILSWLSPYPQYFPPYGFDVPVVWIPHFESAQSTNDFSSFLYPPEIGCEIVQLAEWNFQWYYDGRSPLMITADYWSGLERIDRAALLLHESLHSYFDQEPDNLAIREFIVYITGNKEYRRRHRAAAAELISTRHALPVDRFNR